MGRGLGVRGYRVRNSSSDPPHPRSLRSLGLGRGEDRNTLARRPSRYRHCEERERRSDPEWHLSLDCFASLAMTNYNVRATARDTRRGNPMKDVAVVAYCRTGIAK